MHIFSFPPALRRPHSCPERPRFFLPAVLGLAALCLAAAFQANAEPRAGAKDAIHLDTARLEAQQQRIYTELRPLFNSLLASDDVWTRCAALYAGAGIIRDNTLADLLLFGGFLVWSVFSFRAARQRDAAAGTVYAPGRAVPTVVAVVLGLGAYVAFAFWAHQAWIGVPPFVRSSTPDPLRRKRLDVALWVFSLNLPCFGLRGTANSSQQISCGW